MDGKEVVKQINMRLAELGMSKTTFATLSGVSRASLSQWNVGKSSPSDDALRRINDVLGTNFALSNKTDNMYDTIQMLQQMRDADKFALAVLRDMSEDDVYATMKLIQRLKGGKTNAD